MQNRINDGLFLLHSLNLGDNLYNLYLLLRYYCHKIAIFLTNDFNMHKKDFGRLSPRKPANYSFDPFDIRHNPKSRCVLVIGLKLLHLQYTGTSNT